MIRNYFKIAWRNLRRNKVFSFINIAGLGIGLACSIIILLWVTDERSYDRFHAQADNLYRVVENQHYENDEKFPVASTPGPLGPALQANFPQIVNIARWVFTGATLQYKDKLFFEQNFICTDPSFFSMFSFPLIKGDPKTIFKELNSIVLTEKMAKKYFGEEDPLNKVIRLKIFSEENFIVTGVLADIPRQSHLNFLEFFIPYHYADKNFPWVTTMDNNSIYTYVQLKEGTSLPALNNQIKNFLRKHNQQKATDLYLQPVTAIHLHSNFTADIGGHSSMQYIYIFSIVAILVILIACINFMNLSTARYERRAREVGVRKVIGASKKNLIYQFLGESLFMSVLALLFAIGLILLFIPTFNTLSGKELSLTWLKSSQVFGILGIVVVTGLLAGIYPALFLSSFQPVKVLKGIFRQRSNDISFRKVLVITQFVISVALIVSTLIIGEQLNYIRNKKLGYNKENIINIPASQNYENLKNELEQQPGIASVTMTNNPITNISSSSQDWKWEGKDPSKKILIHELAVDYDFTKTFQMKMLQGRSFSKDFGSDSLSYIINEEALRLMKLKDPVGKKLSDGTIIGVVEDFNFKSIRTRIEPLILRCRPQWCWIVFVKLNPGHIQNTLVDVEKTWKSFNPQGAYQYNFLDQQFDQLYSSENRTGILFRWFAALAIFISCLGLFGLSAYTAEKRTKEIGVRKVLGASVSSITALLSIDFLKLVFISFVIAFPLAWWVMYKWLEDFAYRVHIGWRVFVIAGMAVLLIAVLTVSFQAIKAAIANPVKSLRTE